MRKIANRLRTFTLTVLILLAGSPFGGRLILSNAYARCCASRDNTIGAHVRSDFRITSPPQNAHYQIDPVLPPSQQMVELTAACGSDVEWFVNGTRVTPERDGRIFWQLDAGDWNVRAVSHENSPSKELSLKARATNASAFCSTQRPKIYKPSGDPQSR